MLPKHRHGTLTHAPRFTLLRFHALPCVGCLLTRTRGNRDQPNTTHAGLPLRHSIQSDSGPDRTQSSGGTQGTLRGRTGGPVATMHMSSSNGNICNLVAMSAAPPHTDATEAKLVPNATAPAGAALERDTKRQRSSDWSSLNGQIHGEEAGSECDFANACFVEGDLPNLWEHDLGGWQ